MPSEYSVSIPELCNKQLLQHVLRTDGQEDLAFGLWSPSEGRSRLSALLHTPVLPKVGDRQVHGNASFNPVYFERALALAASQQCGVAFLHSHLGPGWQGMSFDDEMAETKMAGSSLAATDLPLIGLTAGTDGTWSARAWERTGFKQYRRRWCHQVRVVGHALQVYFADHLLPPPDFREHFRRTVTIWGREHHGRLARLRIGIVGLGSVGSLVVKALARMGLTRFVLIDFDEVQTHNLDRLDTADERDLGLLKVEVAKQELERIATANRVEVEVVAASVVEEAGYRAALDCDVLFSCVDRPRPRSVLNHLAYAHLIPVIDGGIEVRFKQGHFAGADWQLQTVAPGRPCLQCLGAFTPDDAATEAAGKLEDSTYLKGLPPDHRFKRNENIFPFSQNLAALEVMQLIEYATTIGGVDLGVQRFRYVPGVLEGATKACLPNCPYRHDLVGQGDLHFTLTGRDFAADAARARQGREKL